jgi:hypothetical protein
VLKNSTLFVKLNSNKLHIPDLVELRGTDRPKLLHVIVADEAFGLTHHIMRPYGGNKLTMKKKYLIIVSAELDPLLNVHLEY